MPLILFTVIRDVRDRGRDVEGCIKQWFAFVKPNFEKVCFRTTLEDNTCNMLTRI
jgi:uridine kinase